MSFRQLLFEIDKNLTNIECSIAIEEAFHIREDRINLANNLKKFYKLSEQKTLSLENKKYQKIIKSLEDEIYFWLKEADESIKDQIEVL
jgi:ribosomal protein L23